MNLLEEVKLLVEKKFRTESADHDWYHIERVLKLAEFIQSVEGGDLLVVQLAALLQVSAALVAIQAYALVHLYLGGQP